MLSTRTMGALVAAAAALSLTGCDSSATATTDGRLSVVASTDVYASIAQAIGGEYVESTAFVDSPDQDPHSYEASARDILAVSKADLVIQNGGGYDDFMTQLLDSAGGDARVLNVVDESGLPGRDEPGFNEHVWYDVPVMQATAEAIANDLGDVDPAHRRAFDANAAAFDRRLRELVDRESALRARLGGQPVAVTEPVPGYLLQALGLTDVTPAAFTEAVEEGDDVAVSTLGDALDLLKDNDVDALIYNEQTAGTITDQLLDAANDAGVPVVGVTESLPAGDDYVSWMRGNLDAISAALTQ